MSRFTGYSIDAYGRMILDRGRMGPFADALAKYVRPGSVVADLGAGTGIFSLLACKLGARHVYAIEPDPSIVVARETAAKNGFADRVTCIQALSTEVTLPEKVDVIVSDLRGRLPLFQGHIDAIVDARKRFLKPEGRLIPSRDVVRCAPVEAPEVHAEILGPWSRRDFDLDLSPAARYATATWSKRHIDVAQLLADPVDLATIDYATVSSPHVDGTAVTTVTRAGTIHGFTLWFDCQLDETLGFSNAPGLPDLVYGRSFAPLPEAVELEAGDRVELRVRANRFREDYVLRWDTRIVRQDGSTREFRQSSSSGIVLSPSELAKRADAFVPRPGANATVDREILAAMTSGASLGTIAREIHERFPNRFDSWREAFERVADLSSKYSD